MDNNKEVLINKDILAAIVGKVKGAFISTKFVSILVSLFFLSGVITFFVFFFRGFGSNNDFRAFLLTGTMVLVGALVLCCILIIGVLLVERIEAIGKQLAIKNEAEIGEKDKG